MPIHGKSAFHGRHLKFVREAIEQYVKQGNAAVVIFRDVDRSSRQGAQATFDLRGEIIRAGGRMEFSGQTYLNDQRNQEMLLGILATSAREESETKSRRKLQGNAAAAERGEVVGVAPWGYRIGKVNGLRVLVPTDLGRQWIPVIFTACVKGNSLRAIRDLLAAEGVNSPMQSGEWNEATIRRVINSPTYKGDREGKGNMEYEPLVSRELWAQANMALKGRSTPGRGSKTLESAIVKPFCGNCWGVFREGSAKNVKQEDGTKKLVPVGRSPMYRYPSGRRGKRYNYFGCTGYGPAHQTCGAPLIAEAKLEEAISASGYWFLVRLPLAWLAGRGRRLPRRSAGRFAGSGGGSRAGG